MNTKFRAKLRTADEILGTKDILEFKNTDNPCFYIEKMNERAKKGEVGTCEPYPSTYPSLVCINFDDMSTYIVCKTWLKDVEEVEIKVESKYPEFTEENVDSIIDQCTRHINNLLDDMPNHLPFPDITSIVAPDKKIENFMNAKKQLTLKIVDALSKMFKSSCCPFCEANTSVGEIMPNYPCMVEPDCSKCYYGKYYNKCDNSFSVYHNIRKANEQLREAIEKYWR